MDPPLPIPNREVKHTNADGTDPPVGRVGRCGFSECPIVKRRPGILRFARSARKTEKPQPGLAARLASTPCTPRGLWGVPPRPPAFRRFATLWLTPAGSGSRACPAAPDGLPVLSFCLPDPILLKPSPIVKNSERTFCSRRGKERRTSRACARHGRFGAAYL